MKRIILSAIFTMAIVLSANAQEHKWFIGGAAGYWSAKNSGFKTTIITVAPEIGYNVTNNFAVAASLGYSNVKRGDYFKADGFIISPYVRYTFLKSGILSAFFDGGGAFGLGDIKGFQAGIAPGIALSLTDRFSVVAHFGFIGYNNGKDIGNYAEAGKGFGIDLSGYQSQLGFYYSF
jgi:hypothetical protein